MITMTETQRLIARARLLRREGKTYDEIRAVLGPIDDDHFRVWLAGIPRPAATRRTHRKDDLRRECRRLRAQGLSYTEISALTGAPQGSISPWVRGVRGPSQERLDDLRLAGLRKAARIKAQGGQRRRNMQKGLAACSVGPLSDQELFLLGVGLYWAEGSKSKSYDLRERATFINSDPDVIDVYMAWLALLGVTAAQCGFRVSIHETADVEAAEQFWAARVGVPVERFVRSTLKKAKPLTNRLNTNEEYRGCLVVSVYKSAVLYRSIEGWWRGLHRQIVRDHRRSTEWSDAPPWMAWRFLSV